MRLTMSEAVRSRSLVVEPLGGLNVDQTNWRDFASTRKMLPLLRPKEELGASSLLTVSWNIGLMESDSFSLSRSALFPVLAGFSGSLAGGGSASGGLGVGKIFSSWFWRLSP